MAQDHTRPDATTRHAESEAARAAHAADRDPTPDEERSAEGQTLDPRARKEIEEALERGAGQKGEGRITGN